MKTKKKKEKHNFIIVHQHKIIKAHHPATEYAQWHGQ